MFSSVLTMAGSNSKQKSGFEKLIRECKGDFDKIEDDIKEMSVKELREFYHGHIAVPQHWTRFEKRLHQNRLCRIRIAAKLGYMKHKEALRYDYSINKVKVEEVDIRYDIDKTVQKPAAAEEELQISAEEKGQIIAT